MKTMNKCKNFVKLVSAGFQGTICCACGGDEKDHNELTNPADINKMVDPTGALQRAGLYNPLPE